MSRIGLKVIKVPTGVTLTLNNGIMNVKGPKGSLDVTVPELIEVKINGDEVSCSRKNEEKHTKQLLNKT